MTSETPRTDALTEQLFKGSMASGWCFKAIGDHARQLERELTKEKRMTKKQLYMILASIWTVGAIVHVPIPAMPSTVLAEIILICCAAVLWTAYWIVGPHDK